MKNDDRKAAIRAYKERKTVAGIYALRCAATGQCWVGRAPDVTTIQNRIWFSLRQGSDPHPTLQAASKAHGADAFTFEIVEQLKDEEVDYVRERMMSERLAHWAKALSAEAI